MKVTRRTLLASLVVASVPLATSFAPPSSTMATTRTMIPTSCFATGDSEENESTSVCDIPKDGASLPRLKGQPGGAKVLRQLELTAADGSKVTLGTKMGDGGVSVVVFLRHLG